VAAPSGSVPPRNVDWDAVAPYYDAYVRATFDVPYFLDLARRAHGPVLELMCGTGRLTLPLVEAGHEVTGVDASPALLARLAAKLREHGLTARLVESDVRTFALGREFALVFVGFHAFAEVLGADERARAMRAIRPHVAPGGTLALAMHNPPVRAANVHDDRRTMGTFPLGEGTLEVSSRWRIEGTRVHGLQRFRELDRAGGLVGNLEVPIAFDLVPPEELVESASRVGLRLRRVLGDYDGAPFDPAASPFAVLEFTPA
jgi:SAM-dependent methyltransferase